MNGLKYFAALLLIVLLVGCVPTRYAWSPDGRWMTVISDDGLRISDVTGNFLPGVTRGIVGAAWFGDSARLVVVKQIDVRDWTELTKYLSAPDVERVTAISDRVTKFTDSYDWTKRGSDSWDAFQTAFAKRESEEQQKELRGSRELLAPVAIYFREHMPADVRHKIPVARIEELMMLTAPVKSVQVCAVTADGVAPVKQIMSSLKTIRNLRVSPAGTAVAITAEAPTPHDSELDVAPTDGSGSATRLSDCATWYPDWSADGRDLIFIHANQPAVKDEGRLGMLTRTTVLDEHNTLLKTPATVDLLSVVFSELSRLRVVNGQILCAMADVKFPATTATASDRLELFSLSGNQNEQPVRILNDKSLELVGETVQYFEPSPDGQRLSIPDKGGKVYVFDLAGQNMVLAQPKDVMNSDNKPQLFSVPQWRSADELTVVGENAEGRTTVELWSTSSKTSKDLSANWPADLVSKKASAPGDQEPGGL